MKQKYNYKIINRYSISGLAILVIAAAAFTVFIIKPGSTDAASSTKTAAVKPATPDFSFTGAAGWVQGPTNKTSMALFHGSSIAQPAADGCFTSIEHKTGTVDVAAQLHKQQASLASSGATMMALSTPTTTIQTTAGPQRYQLHQYRLTGGSTQLMGGLELGYVQLSDGYLVMQGHCNTADQLAVTIPALQAYRFDVH